MNIVDIIYFTRWWGILFIFGTIFLPLTFTLFNNFKDKGYIFSKAISLILISYSIFVISSLKLLTFSIPEIILLGFVFLLINIYFLKKLDIKKIFKENLRLFVIEEIIFIITFAFWTYVRGNLPDIHGLEKFMDFGFINSILRSNYFPPKDMWYSGLSINYYYFGHFVTAVIIKISLIPSFIGYNLMLSTLFGLTFASVFSIAINLFDQLKWNLKVSLTGLLSAVLVTLCGNLTTIYTFFKPYTPLDKAVPFWQLPFMPFNFPNSYWYPNATRFIPFTIHEFPIYSFVVSDLHGHVLDIPFVLLTILFSFSIFIKKEINKLSLVLMSFLLAVMYMTNAWDGLIYMLLAFIIIGIKSFWKNKKLVLVKNSFYDFIKKVAIVGLGFITFSIPFSVHFKPFVSGIGIICAPKFLTDIGKIGPFLFEANHCQRSPFWQLTILYGFFYFFVIAFILFLRLKKKYKITASDQFIAFLIILSTILIIVPEFIYVKDIYPLHYRANTMFKLVYEAFIMLSISSGYIIVKILSELKIKKIIILFFVPTLLLLYLVLSYPIFAINSFYDNLQLYKGLNGTKYLNIIYPSDYSLVSWINKNINGQPVILEANGDSYTDYARISVNTGLPTVIGWPVHEWLWRGTYDIVAPRITDVQNLYTSNNLAQVKSLIKKYNISYVVVSDLERKKYLNLNEDNFKILGKIVYNKQGAKLYKIME